MNQNELIIDNFAAGGGASLGIELALGRWPDIAINHDREALRTRQSVVWQLRLPADRQGHRRGQRARYGAGGGA